MGPIRLTKRLGFMWASGRTSNRMVWVSSISLMGLTIMAPFPTAMPKGKEGSFSKGDRSTKARCDTMWLRGKAC